MRLLVAVTASLLAFSVVSTYSQTQDLKSREILQVKKSVLIKDAKGVKVDEQKVEDLKLWEDGTEQSITALEAKSSPLYLEIVLDDSGSMGSVRGYMKDISKFIIQSLEPGSQVQVVRFGGAQRITVPNVWAEDKTTLLAALDVVPSQGGSSPVYDAVSEGLEQIKLSKTLPGDKRFAIVVITDCMEGGSAKKSKELFDELVKEQVPLFTVSVSPFSEHPLPEDEQQEFVQKYEKFHHDTALATGGSVYFPRSRENAKLPLSRSLMGLASELQSQFVLTYTPTNQTRDGKERKLRIETTETFDGKRTAAIKETHLVTLQK